jgi:hypothetical protein
LGNAYLSKAEHEAKEGLEPNNSFNALIENYKKATSLDMDYLFVYMNNWYVYL